VPPSTWVQSGHRVMCWLYPDTEGARA
jgi:hypothetical protein